MKTTQPIIFLVFLLSILSASNLDAQKLMALGISDSLTQNANAVIRSHTQSITIQSIDKMEIEEQLIVTVFNENGDHLLQYGKTYDDASKIEELSGKVYNALGIEIKSIKKKDFKDFNVGGAGVSITDTRVKVVTYVPSSYPITIVFQSKVNSKNTGFIQSWNPLRGYNVSTEKSTYQLFNYSGIPLKHHFQKGYRDLPVILKEESNRIYGEMKNVPAISHESMCPSFSKISPKLNVALDQFVLHDVEGYGGDWHTFGKWYHDVLLNQGLKLNADVVSEVKSLVVDITDPLEKAAKIYQYVQDRTRYISIQLGIGGWRPYPAQEVHDLGYGDCKGLTHYMRALLKAVDVEAYIAVVYAGDGKKDITREFTRMQGNHVILCIPQSFDTTWIECTSQSSPFGYIGQFTDDRDVLLVTPQGGEIVHTKKYGSEENLRTYKANISIDELGALMADINIESEGMMYDRSRLYLHQDESDQKEYFLKYWESLNRLSVDEMSHQVDRKNARLKESLKLSVPEYAYVKNDDIIFQLNPFDCVDEVVPRMKSRNFPFEIRNGKTYHDEYIITIPSGYRISSLPDLNTIESETGSYLISVERIDNATILYKRTFSVKGGVYPPESYTNHRKFLKKVKKSDNLKISITNKS